MPEMNGLDTAKLVRNHLKGAKIILTTGYDLREEARSEGLLYLQKPFSTEELAEDHRARKFDCIISLDRSLGRFLPNA